MANCHNLIAFQKANELAAETYRITQSFPKEEMYGITSQLRRSALSIPVNIVEGYGRKSKKELRQFLNISLGSLAETAYLFSFSKNLGYHKQDSTKINILLEETGKVLWGFYKSLEDWKICVTIHSCLIVFHFSYLNSGNREFIGVYKDRRRVNSFKHIEITS